MALLRVLLDCVVAWLPVRVLTVRDVGAVVREAVVVVAYEEDCAVAVLEYQEA